MRLTLRTLMAYRDGVLSRADSEDLHRRIQQSQDAGNLLKRINSITQLPQILAPPVMGKGLGGDPNSIAEYLDDSLHGAKVPELERVCLVSDVQLAELADCHELLSSAIHTKISVPPELRKKAIAIRDPQQRAVLEQELKSRVSPRSTGAHTDHGVRTDAAHAAGAAGAHSLAASPEPVQVQTPMLASGGESIKPQGLNLESLTLAHEVPEYLVGSTRDAWRVPLAIAGLLAVLALLVWQTLGPWDRVVELFASAPQVESVNSGGRRQTNGGPIAQVADIKTQNPPPANADSSPPTPTDAITALEQATDNLESSQLPPVQDVSGNSASPAGQAQESQSPDSSIDSEAVAASETENGLHAVWLPKSAREQQAVVLALMNNKRNRIQAGEPIPEQTQLIVPPVTRITLDLPRGVLWTACGPSLLQLDNSGDADVPMLRVPLCRSLIRGGPDGRKVELSTPVGDFLIELNDASSIASCEVAYRPETRGSVLDRRSYKPVFIVVAVEGGISVKTGSASDAAAPNPPTVLNLGEGLAQVGQDIPKKFRLQSIPAWYRMSVERPIDELAAEDLHEFLLPSEGAEEDLQPVIARLCNSRKPETAALAVQISLLCGNWQPLLNGFLSDERMRSHWTPTIDLARQVLAINPAAGDKLRQQLLDAHGDSGELLFEFLCGLTDDQLLTDGLSKLVVHLDSPRLDVRVLAAYQLERLTGKNLGYQPEAPNRASVQQWRRELATNRLSIIPIRDPIGERVPR